MRKQLRLSNKATIILMENKLNILKNEGINLTYGNIIDIMVKNIADIDKQ